MILSGLGVTRCTQIAAAAALAPWRGKVNEVLRLKLRLYRHGRVLRFGCPFFNCVFAQQPRPLSADCVGDIRCACRPIACERCPRLSSVRFTRSKGGPSSLVGRLSILSILTGSANEANYGRLESLELERPAAIF